MRIALIGTGRVGATLAGHLVGVGHEVILANSRPPQTLSSWLRVLGPLTSADTPRRAAERAELVIMATPWRERSALPIPSTVVGKVIIDVMNAEPEDNLDYRPSSVWTAERLPGARVVKAFNTVHWQQLRDHIGGSERLVIPICGDDSAAKAEVAALIRQLGFEPVDTGSLVDGSRLQEPDGPLFRTNLSAAAIQELLVPVA